MKFTLTNYWGLLIWPLIMAVVGYALPQENVKGEHGTETTRWSYFAALLYAVPLMIWAAYRSSSFGDTGAYISMYDEAPNAIGGILQYASTQGKDKGFYVLMALFKSIFGSNYVPFFMLVACIQLLCLVSVYQKYSNDFWLSMFCFVMVDYLSYMQNGMRQFIVVALLFACFPLILKKKYIQLIIIILLLSTIHMTALLYLPFIFIVQGEAWNKKTILFILAVLIAVLFLDRFTSIVATVMDSTQYSYEVEDFLSDSGVSLMRVIFCSIPTIISFVCIRYIKQAADPVLNLCVNLSIVTTGFFIIGYFTSGIYVGRIPIFFSLSNYILYPRLCDLVFTKESARVVKWAIVFAFIFFFYYQVHVAWGIA